MITALPVVVSSLLASLDPSPVEVDRIGWTPPGLHADDGIVGDLAYDGRGRLWLASSHGIVRWDGARATTLRPRAGGAGGTNHVSAHGDLVVGIRFNGLVLEVDDGALTPVLDEKDEPVFAIKALAAADGLWVHREDEGLSHRDAGGDWTHLVVPALEGHRSSCLEARDDGGLFVCTLDAGLWSIDAGGRATQIVDGRIFGVDELGDGRLAVIRNFRSVVVDEHGTVTPVGVERLEDVGWDDERKIYPDKILAWGEHIVLGGSLHLDVVHPDGATERTIGTRSEWVRGVRSLVGDDEANLWVGTRQGAVRLAQPTTSVWTRNTGLIDSDIRFGMVAGDRVYATSWRGVSVMEREGDAWRARPLPEVDTVRLTCAGGGGVWVPGTLRGETNVRGWVRLDGQTPRLHRAARSHRCAPGRDGRVWLVEEDAVWEVDASGRERGPYAAPREVYVAGAYETTSGTLMTGGGLDVCEAELEALRAGSDAWHCHTMPEHVGPQVHAFFEPEPGEIWASTEGDGIWVRRAGEWSRHPINDDLALNQVGLIMPSARGGAWIAASPVSGRIARVDGEWALVERLGAPVGLDGERFSVVTEGPTGDLWVATRRFLAHVPHEARSPELGVPEVVLTGLEVDGDPVSPDLRRVQLESASSPVVVEFAALTSKHPSALRYRFRIDDGVWSGAQTEPSLRLAGLAPGTHAIELAASYDGQRWSDTPAGVQVDVPFPWYRQSWFYVASLLALVSVGYVVMRIRLGVRLRLLRQRAQIAMDLHDELGAGLGSIRILAGIASEPKVPTSKASDLTARIENTAQELGAALTDIVWSLKRSSNTLESLARHLVDRGRDLFADGRAEFRAELGAGLPRRRLSLPVSRQLQLIVLEALHNAAKHASAEHVTLRIAQDDTRWSITVTDDGRGFDPEDPKSSRTGGGNGMRTMKTRAEAIGATLSLRSEAGEGTRVRVLLPKKW